MVRTILGDFLKIDHLYDPKVQGTVTLQTTKPLASNAVLATLETLLRMNGAALITGDPYRVVTAEEAQRPNWCPSWAMTAQHCPRFSGDDCTLQLSRRRRWRRF